MALSILERPLGIGLGTCIAATIDEDYAGYATINTVLPHNLATNDYVYITSNIEDYNGFWPIHFIDGYHFFLLNPDGTYVAYLVDASITYCPEAFRHGWSCVELPIAYKLKSTRYPVNGIDTARTVIVTIDDNGYWKLSLSGSLGTFEELDFIKISGASDDNVNGVFQILQKWSTSVITINLAYNSTNSFAGASVILNYNSYNAVINIYAGLNSSHHWASRKPYELAVTLNLVPDDNNEIHFSINEILKSYITIANNTLQATLPNSLDSFVMFYITFGESYDQSNGYTIATVEGSVTNDQANFEGIAVNSILEFKNQYSGYLTDYLMEGDNMTAKFLTLFSSLVLFSGCTQDVSFLNAIGSKYNIPAGNASVVGYTQTIGLGSSTDWALSIAQVSLTSASGESFSEIMYKPSTLQELVTYKFSWNVSGTGTYTGGGGNALSLFLGFYDASNNLLASLTMLSATGSSKNSVSSGELQVPTGTTKVGFRVTTAGLISGGYDVKINSFTQSVNSVYIQTKKYLNSSLLATTHTLLADYGLGLYRHFLTFESGYDQFKISVNHSSSDTGRVSEELTIDLNNDCSNQNIFLVWLNNLGGFDSWNFTAWSDHIINIQESGETKQNIFHTWPKSYGTTANTIKKQTYRDSGKQILVRSQHISLAQLQAIEYIKSSILVELVTSRTDKRRVLVDADSFTSHRDNDKLYSLSFTITYTDNIPSQKV